MATTRTAVIVAASIVVIGVLIILLIVGVLWYRHKQQQKSVQPAPTTSTVTPTPGTGSGPGKYYHHGSVLLPNPQISPGEVRTTDLNIICGESTKDFRHTSESLKQRVYENYDEIPHQKDCHDTIHISKKGKQRTEACEVDHIISLELGGADSERNLFPQPYNPPDGLGAHAKDAVENYLHRQVCYHGYPIEKAQKEIATDWYQVYTDAHLHQ